MHDFREAVISMIIIDKKLDLPLLHYYKSSLYSKKYDILGQIYKSGTVVHFTQ